MKLSLQDLKAIEPTKKPLKTKKHSTPINPANRIGTNNEGWPRSKNPPPCAKSTHKIEKALSKSNPKILFCEKSLTFLGGFYGQIL